MGKFSVTIPDCKIHLSIEDLKTVKSAVEKFPTGRWLAVGPGANWHGKKWPADRFGMIIIEALKSKVFDAAVILGSSKDLSDDLKVCLSDLPILDLRGRTNLNQAAAFLSKAFLFIGNDSGLGHIASAVGAKTLTLFGPGLPQKYRPWGQKAGVVIAPNRNLSDLSWRMVWENLILESQL